MARRKKEPQEVPLTEKQVWDVLTFANSVYTGMYPNVFTPELTNARIKDLTMTPQVATLEKITKALESPKDSEESLIGYSQWLELNSMLYKRVLYYFSGLLAFDWTYIATNIKKDEEYKSKKYKDDLYVIQEFFDRFDVKEQFRLALRQMLRNETYFGIFRDDGNKYVLQELPRKYCKITGRFDYGLVFDFDMNWFLQGGVSLDMYPPIFKKLFRNTFMKDDKDWGYDPASPISMRNDTFAYWTQTSPKDGFVAFKFIPEIATNVPFLSPFMPDAVMQPIIRSLQTDAYIAQASKIIVGQVPFLKDAKASVKDALAIAPETLGKFLALMKSALPTAIKVASAPLEDMQGVEFTGSNEIYDTYLNTSASSAGINSRLIYSKDRQNLLETKSSLDVDQNILRPVYNVFGNMMEYWSNQRTKHYKFKYLLEGFNTSIDREERLTTVMKYAESGIVLEQKMASAIGMTPFDFRRQIAETKSFGFVDKLTPIVKSSQVSKEDGKGRPQKSDSSLSDSGSQSREDGSNDEKGEV